MQERTLVNDSKELDQVATPQQRLVEIDARRLANIVLLQSGMNRAQRRAALREHKLLNERRSVRVTA